MGKAGFEERGV
jgi:hypothetical protein